MSSKKVELRSNFKGFVSAIINADYEQQIILRVKRTDGSEITSATFEGQGVRVHAVDIFNGREYWSFGPFPFNAHLTIDIRHKRDGLWKDSKTVGPLTIVKRPEPDYPIEFHLATVISDDSAGDNSHDDCTVQVLQYRD